jgi:hypothetical protein
MVISGWKFLDSVRIKKVVRTLADELEIDNQVYPFLARTPVVAADNDEIVGKFKGRVYAADIIADDQEAVTYENGSFEFTSNTIPNIKIGTRLTQSMINRIELLRRNLGDQRTLDYFSDWEVSTGNRLVQGLRQRVNALICAMQVDGMDYNRLGMDLRSATWGMPSDLKVTAANGWDDATNSTPISDMQVIMTEVAPDNYGERYDRVTMGSKAFRYLTQSTEFQRRVSGDLRYTFTTGQLNFRDTGAMQSMLSNLLNAEVEVYDGSYTTKNNTGKDVRQRVLPTNKVILSTRSDDNNLESMDFANGVVTESVAGSAIGLPGFSGEEFGPVVYMTSNNDLNPPDIRVWAVMRGFPRKHRETATAVLTVGSGNSWL